MTLSVNYQLINAPVINKKHIEKLFSKFIIVLVRMNLERKDLKQSFVSFKKGVTYALTLTLSDDERQFFNIPPHQRVNNIQKFMTRYLSFLGQYAYYELHLEVSKAGRLHYHGIITPRDELDFLLSVPNKFKKLGFYEIDTIDDISIWKEYYTKQDYLFDKAKLPHILKFAQSNPLKITTDIAPNNVGQDTGTEAETVFSHPLVRKPTQRRRRPKKSRSGLEVILE